MSYGVCSTLAQKKNNFQFQTFWLRFLFNSNGGTMEEGGRRGPLLSHPVPSRHVPRPAPPCLAPLAACAATSRPARAARPSTPRPILSRSAPPRPASIAPRPVRLIPPYPVPSRPGPPRPVPAPTRPCRPSRHASHSVPSASSRHDPFRPAPRAARTATSRPARFVPLRPVPLRPSLFPLRPVPPVSCPVLPHVAPSSRWGGRRRTRRANARVRRSRFALRPSLFAVERQGPRRARSPRRLAVTRRSAAARGKRVHLTDYGGGG